MAPLMDWAADTWRTAEGWASSKSMPTHRPVMPTRFKAFPPSFFIAVEVVARHEGAIAKPQLQAFLDANL